MAQSQRGDGPVVASAEELLAVAVRAAVMGGATPKQLNEILFAGVGAARAGVGPAAGHMGEIKATSVPWRLSGVEPGCRSRSVRR